MSNPIKIYHRHILRPYMWYKYLFFVNSVPNSCTQTRPTTGTSYELVVYIITKEYHDTLSGVGTTPIEHRLNFIYLVKDDVGSVYTFSMEKPICHVSAIMRKITYRNGVIQSQPINSYVTYYCNQYNIDNNAGDVSDWHLFTPGTYELSNTAPAFYYRVYNDTPFDYVITSMTMTYMTHNGSSTVTTITKSGNIVPIDENDYYYYPETPSGVSLSDVIMWTSDEHTADYEGYIWLNDEILCYVTYSEAQYATINVLQQLLNNNPQYDTVINSNDYLDCEYIYTFLNKSKTYAIDMTGYFVIPANDSSSNYTWKWGKTLREYTLTTKSFSSINNKTLSITDGEWHFKAS